MKNRAKLGIFERYLYLWVGACMVVGLLMSVYLPAAGEVIDEWKSVFAVNAIDGSSIDLRMRSHEFEQRLKEHREK